MGTAISQFVLTGPFYLCVLLGFLVVRIFRIGLKLQSWFVKAIFSFLIPILLFTLTSDPARFSNAQFGVLFAFFGGCVIVFFFGIGAAKTLFRLEKSEVPIFGIGGVVSNNVMLGLPLAQLTIGPAATATVAMVLLFNSLILWSLVTVSVEWARNGSFEAKAIFRTLRGIVFNPVMIGIGLGVAWAFSGWKMPGPVGDTLHQISQLAGPLALLALGMNLATHTGKIEWKIAGSLAFVKLVVHPAAVWILAALIHLPALETRVVVLLASIAIGSNVFLMSKQFQALEKPVSQSMLLSTFASTLTTPLWLAVIPSV